jgi:SagB-type dehydrogenase family enzyme
VEKSLNSVSLPLPKFKGIAVEEAISRRRSIRSFKKEPITLGEISMILWAAQGITGEEWGYKLRSVPSAGALYPIEIYLATKDGIFHYLPEPHKLIKISDNDVRRSLARAALGQSFIEEAPLVLVITAVFERTMAKYGDRGHRYVYAEAGHVSQNVYLECESLGLSTVAVGAFYDKEVQHVLEIPNDHKPIYIMPIGHKKH